jgi:hypothetical protein
MIHDDEPYPVGPIMIHDDELYRVGPYDLPHAEVACLLGPQRDAILSGTRVNCHVRDRRKGGKGKPKAKGTKKKPAAALAEEGEDEEDEEGEEEDPVAEEVAEEEAEEETEAAAQRAHLFAQLPPKPEKKLDPEHKEIRWWYGKRSHKGDTVVVFRKGKTSDKAQPPLKPNTGMSSSSNAPPPMVTTTTTTTTTTSTPIPFESYHDSSSRYEYC